jgi:aconitate hydratase
MGILPLQFPAGQSWETLGLTGEETFDIADLSDALAPGSQLTVRATAADGSAKEFPVLVRIDTPVELDYYRNGGILQTVLQKLRGD